MSIASLMNLPTRARAISALITVMLIMLSISLLAGCNLASAPSEPGADLPTAMVARRDFSPAPIIGPVEATVRNIYQRGQALGNRADVFSKVGDSITVSRSFMHAIGENKIELGNYQHLASVITHFGQNRARNGNSFNNTSLAAGVGWAAWGVLEPSLADKAMCFPAESPLACEYRLVKPAFALIMFGTNDVGYRTQAEFERDLQRIIDYSIEQGVIPLLSTMPPRPDVGSKVDAFNQAVQELARTNNLPVWDYYSAMITLPNLGLTGDLIHPSSPPARYDDTARFIEPDLNYGYVVRNLLALELLNEVWSIVQ